jgi:dinuclear metal center YbgI/SA1388 family protein
MQATVADIIHAMEGIAPSRLAEKWDNSGLQVGQKDRPVKKILIALDPLLEVVHYACTNDFDLLITHHPLIFTPLTSINLSDPVGSIINKAILHKLSIFAAHTNLDSVKGGLNDVLANKIGLYNLKVLGNIIDQERCKLVIYVPVEYEDIVLGSLFEHAVENKAGKIGEYACCSFRGFGKGTFKPGSAAKPFIGKRDEINHIPEVRIETVVMKNHLNTVIEHVKKKHPYETMAYDVYPLSLHDIDGVNSQGIGRIGDLKENTTLADLAKEIKKKLALKTVKIAGRPDLSITKAALCTGSGSGLMDSFFSSQAQVYISGDFRYHDARSAEDNDRGLIDIGHFASEYPVVELLAKRLYKALSKAGIDVTIEKSSIEKDPFMIM